MFLYCTYFLVVKQDSTKVDSPHPLPIKLFDDILKSKLFYPKYILFFLCNLYLTKFIILHKTHYLKLFFFNNVGSLPYYLVFICIAVQKHDCLQRYSYINPTKNIHVAKTVLASTACLVV